MAEETKLSQSAEQQVAELGQHRTRLEADLAEIRQAHAKSQQALEISQQELLSHQESARAEQSRLQVQIQESRATKAELEQKINRLTEALAEENEVRQSAEQQAAELGQHRTRLEADLAEGRQEHAKLRHELEVSQQKLQEERLNCLAEQSRLEARTKESQALAVDLAAVRTRLEEEALRCRTIAEKVAATELARAELASQAHITANVLKEREDSILSLDSQVRERQGEIARLGSLLESEIAQRRREHSQAEALEKQAAALSNQLAEKNAAEQKWHQRETELEHHIRQQKEQLADSAAASKKQELELKGLKRTLDDLQVIQSALCARVRELTAQQDRASKRIEELNGESQAAAKAVQARDQELAGLRHAILDAARIAALVRRERLQMDSQAAEGWKRMTGTLLHTPLSMVQRGLVTEIVSALDVWSKWFSSARHDFEFQVEPPDLQRLEFNCSDLLESAVADVRNHAEKAGVKGQITVVGPVPEYAHGSAHHIHQLITMLSSSLIDLGCAENLEAQVTCQTDQGGTSRILFSFLLSSPCSEETLYLRLRTITEASAALRVVQHGGPELALSAAWQLALALGGSPLIERTANQKVHVQVSLPLQVTSSSFTEANKGN